MDGGKMFLPILAVWIVLTVSPESSSGMRCKVCPPCCLDGSESADVENFKCFEQTAGKACCKHFFVIIADNRSPLCIKPNSTWLQNKIKNENLTCPVTIATLHKNHKPGKFLKKQIY